jgi:hypothetical protein
MKNILVAFVLILQLCPSAFAASAGPADFDKPQPITIEGYTDHAMEPFLSREKPGHIH